MRARAHVSQSPDRGAISTAAFIWTMAFLALAALFAGLGWAGVFDGDDDATSEGGGASTTVPGEFNGTVVDAISGEPLGGVTVTPTDESGAPISSLAAITPATGTYHIDDLTEDEYGLYVDGTLVDHERGYVAISTGPYGRLVVATWGDAATSAPGAIGDIALDPLTTPTSTEPTTTNTPTTAEERHGPEIGELTVTPQLVRNDPCDDNTASFSIEVSDPQGVASVIIEWTYPTYVIGAAPGTAHGGVMLTAVPGTNRWQGSASFTQRPLNDPTWIVIKVVATDDTTMYRSETFAKTLAITTCRFIIL